MDFALDRSAIGIMVATAVEVIFAVDVRQLYRLPELYLRYQTDVRLLCFQVLLPYSHLAPSQIILLNQTKHYIFPIKIHPYSPSYHHYNIISLSPQLPYLLVHVRQQVCVYQP